VIETTKCDENLDQATGILGLHFLSGEGAPVAGRPGVGGVVRDELKASLPGEAMRFCAKNQSGGESTESVRTKRSRSQLAFSRVNRARRADHPAASVCRKIRGAGVFRDRIRTASGSDRIKRYTLRRLLFDSIAF